MRILFISQLFDPENSIKGLEFARRLTALGHEVEIVTTFPSYPGGKIFPGYRLRWKQIEVVDGVRVVRLPTFISHGASAGKRMLSYASFGAIATLHSLFFSKKPDVIYAYYPPVVVGLTAMFIGFFRRTPYVYDVQDLWPDALIATGMVRPGFFTRLIDNFCRLIYHRAARVVVLSNGYRDALLSRRVPHHKVSRIFNWCDEGRIDAVRGRVVDAPPVITFDKYCFNIVYAGNLGAAQALEHVLDAARVVLLDGAKQIRFVFIGAGVREASLKAKARSMSLENVQFFPQVSADQIGSILSAADVLLAHLDDEPVFEITIPSKTQAYLMAGRPILMAVRGEAGRIVLEAEAGLVVDPCQPELLAKAAIEMSMLSLEELSRMAKNGRSFYERKMSMSNGVQEVDALLESVLKRP